MSRAVQTLSSALQEKLELSYLENSNSTGAAWLSNEATSSNPNMAHQRANHHNYHLQQSIWLAIAAQTRVCLVVFGQGFLLVPVCSICKTTQRVSSL